MDLAAIWWPYRVGNFQLIAFGRGILVIRFASQEVMSFLKFQNVDAWYI